MEALAGQAAAQKTVGIVGIGVIAEALALKCKGMGMTVVGITSAPRDRGFRQCTRDQRVSKRRSSCRLSGVADAVLGRHPSSHRNAGVHVDETHQLPDQRRARRRGRRGRAGRSATR